MKWYITVFLFVFCPLMSMGQEIINMGNKREIFVDDYLIDKLDNLRLQIHHPRDEGPVLYFDKPWEGSFSTYTTIIKDGDQFRAYYRGLRIPIDGDPSEVTCYARSRDGIVWEKPNLGLYEIDGTYDNNVVLAHASPVPHNFSPFLDTNPNALAEERYKGVGGLHHSGLFAYVSADGLIWKKKQEAPVQQGWLDTQNVVFWSEHEQLYVCYSRGLTKGWEPGTIRIVNRATSPDFINWTPFVDMTFGDTPVEHLYTNQTSSYFRAPHIYIAIGARFFPSKRIMTAEQAERLNFEPRYFSDCSDVFLMSTRGDMKFTRTFMESFIRPGIGLNNWGSRTNYPALNVLQTGTAEMSVYVNQDYAQPTAHLRRYSLRLDGFASIAAPYKGGEALTKLFTFSGNELEINFSTSAAGEIRFEIQDENGKPIPGFTLEDSPTIIGNEIARVVQWTGNRNLNELNGKPVRLRMVMKDADLYSIRFK